MWASCRLLGEQLQLLWMFDLVCFVTDIRTERQGYQYSTSSRLLA